MEVGRETELPGESEGGGHGGAFCWGVCGQRAGAGGGASLTEAGSSHVGGCFGGCAVGLRNQEQDTRKDKGTEAAFPRRNNGHSSTEGRGLGERKGLPCGRGRRRCRPARRARGLRRALDTPRSVGCTDTGQLTPMALPACDLTRRP